MMGAKCRQAQTAVVCFFVLFITVQCSKVTSDIIEDLLSETKYNSKERPQADSGRPVDVYMNMYVTDLSDFSETKMEYSMTLYLRQLWKDERLAYKGYDGNITLNHKQFDRIWTSDVFIPNLKTGVFHTITVPNRLIRLSPDGTVLYSQRLTLTLACNMAFDKFPMDKQTCKIEFESYAYTTEDIDLHWRTDTKAMDLNGAISLPDYHIRNVSSTDCRQIFKSTQMFSGTHGFSCLRANFHLERRLGAYMLSTYLPSLLVVLASWASFWIDSEAAPARISLGILTMLTITTQSSGQGRFPAVSFTKAIDVWMATCLVFVFGAFIEYSVVNILARRARNKTPVKVPLDEAQIIGSDVCYGKILDARLVDIFCRVAFPILFLIFNVIYWPFYLL